MAKVSDDVKHRLSIVIEVGKVIFQYGFIPTILYLGFKQGNDPGMPEITLENLLW